MNSSYSIMKKLFSWICYSVFVILFGLSVILLLYSLDEGIYKETSSSYLNSNMFIEQSYHQRNKIEAMFENNTLTNTNYIDSSSDFVYEICLNDEVILTNQKDNTVFSSIVNSIEKDGKEYKVKYGLSTIKQGYYSDWNYRYNLMFKFKYLNIVAIFMELVIILSSVVYLCAATGHSDDNGSISLFILDKIPLEITLIVLYLSTILMPRSLLRNIMWSSTNDIIKIILLIILGLIVSLGCLYCFLSIVDRLKNKVLLKNTITYYCLTIFLKICAFCFRMVNELSMLKKSILFYLVAFVFIPLVLLNLDSFGLIVFYFLTMSVLYFGYMIGLRKLLYASKEISDGKYIQIDTKYMSHEQKNAAKSLNSISEGLEKAVNERMKAEHLKTELITNVSHDIKTPLTSIVNYVDLLKKTHSEEQQKDYLEILTRQTNRLKKLTEDIVEVSKATTGNLQVNLEVVDGNTFLAQVIGEYEEVFMNNDLEVCTEYKSEQANILIDGNLCWRAIDNCFNNIKKYAAKNSRVYIDSKSNKEFYIITIRNISNHKLNISPEELMERFVQGDVSRFTDGSGLGLNIAKSLIELQKGKFDISIDGDLFKVIIQLPLANIEK